MEAFNKLIFITIALSLLKVQPTFALSSPENHPAEVSSVVAHEEKGFNAGEFVINHVADSYGWHITNIGSKHISIPLPVILYSPGRGFFIFSSSRLHGGQSEYQGFAIAAEGSYKGKIVEVANGQIVGRPWDFSITKTVAGAMVSSLLILVLFLSVARMAKKSAGKTPKGVQNLIEPVIVFVRDEIAVSSIGEKHYERFMPFLLTVFFFILINNLLGIVPIIPFGANITGNISVTMVLALFTFAITNLNGNRQYWKEIFNPDVPWWMKYPIPLMPLVEFLGIITKPFVLMVRLFANMLAGHLIVTVFVSLIFIFTSIFGTFGGWAISPVSIVFSVFISLLEVLVSFVQAYVFTLLSALYFGMAKAEHH